ncbi:MAG: LPS export ABC transporter periplasmic protein LptC [Balneolaceae bacterium]
MKFNQTLNVYHFTEIRVIVNNFLESKRRFLIFLSFVLVITAGCSQLSDFDDSQVQSALNDSLLTSTESWGVNMTLLKNENRQVVIEGSYALNIQEKDREETKISGPVYVQLYDSTGTMETEAWSKRAVYLAAKNEFELYDSVRVHTSKDRHLYTEYLKWSQFTEEISSPNFVIIVTPTDSIAGRGFNGATDLSTYTIQEPRGRLLVD